MLNSAKRSDSVSVDVPNTNRTMTGQLLRLIKAWHALNNSQQDLDFKKAAWAREFRAYYPTEEQFFRGCVDELGLTRYQSEDLLLRARTGDAVKDVSTWNRLGGFREIRSVVALPPKEQIIVLEIAKSTGRAVRTLVKERLPPPAPIQVTPAPMKAADKKQISDAAAFAQFIADNVSRLPKMTAEFETRLRMYVPGMRR